MPMAYRLQNLQANGQMPEEVSQSLLTNKKQGKMRPCDTTSFIKST
jgi:hypothetical protein